VVLAARSGCAVWLMRVVGAGNEPVRAVMSCTVKCQAVGVRYAHKEQQQRGHDNTQAATPCSAGPGRTPSHYDTTRLLNHVVPQNARPE